MLDIVARAASASGIVGNNNSVPIIKPRKTIKLSSSVTQNQQQNPQIIVIPHNMLVNGCISAKDLKSIIKMTPTNLATPSANINNNRIVIQPDTSPSIKIMENRPSAKRPLASPDSCYGSDTDSDLAVKMDDCSSLSANDADEKPRKRANLDHLSAEEKMMRRKLKNRVAAQNARDKKRMKMDEIEMELNRIKAHAKTLEARNAQLVGQNRRLQAENDCLKKSDLSGLSKGVVRTSADVASPVVVNFADDDVVVVGDIDSRSPEPAEGTGSALGSWIDDGTTFAADADIQTFCRQQQKRKLSEIGGSNSDSNVSWSFGGKQGGVGKSQEIAAQKEENVSAADVKPTTTSSENYFVADETRACELMLDKYLHQATSSAEAIFDTDNGWEENFEDLFPDLPEF